MNEELEESKRTIKDYIHDWIGNSTDEDGYTRYEIGEEEQKFFEAIEIVLQALDNSIPKEKVEETFEYIEDYVERLNGPDEDIEYIKNKKQELLEGK